MPAMANRSPYSLYTLRISSVLALVHGPPDRPPSQSRGISRPVRSFCRLAMDSPCTLCSASTSSSSLYSPHGLFNGILTSVGCGRSILSSAVNSRSSASDVEVNGSPTCVFGQETLTSTIAVRPAARRMEMQ